MKTKFLFLLFSVYLSFAVYSQTTSIPDTNFEQALINSGHDDAKEGSVLTNNINTLTFLGVSSKSISDLMGIEDFVASTHLDCNSNSLTNLGVSNSAL